MIDDAMNRIKVRRGSELPQSKLTEDDVVLIRGLVDEREKLKQQARQLTNAKIADKFGVSNRTIDRITAGEIWVYVE